MPTRRGANVRYILHQPLPFQGMKVNEEDNTHAPQGYNIFILRAKVVSAEGGR